MLSLKNEAGFVRIYTNVPDSGVTFFLSNHMGLTIRHKAKSKSLK